MTSDAASSSSSSSSRQQLRCLADYAASGQPLLKLPHPYQTAYTVSKADSDKANGSRYRIRQLGPGASPLPQPLHSDALTFSEPRHLKSSDQPNGSNNTPWGRARRSPSVAVAWSGNEPATVGHIWLLTYMILTLRPSEEALRLTLSGSGAARLSSQLTAVGLAVPHPLSKDPSHARSNELLLLRGAFWQGAGSPFGARPAWAPEEQDPNLAGFPLPPPNHIMTDEASRAMCWHPRRRAKPKPGSVVYSRYIPHLRETFSMIALDWQDEKHLDLFHTWQNDPRVSQGWNETGTREQHREYLRKTHEDPRQITILARFDDVPFAYFEVYWAKVGILCPNECV